MVGGENFNGSQVNLADAARSETSADGGSPGSAFKVFTLAAAMEQDYDLNATWYGPSARSRSRTRVLHGRRAVGAVERVATRRAGYFSLLSATAHSVNTVFAQVTAQLGPGDGRRHGAPTWGSGRHLEPVCSITLGTEAVNPLEMTNAYATLAAHGGASTTRPRCVELADHERRSRSTIGSREPRAGARRERRRPRDVRARGRRDERDRARTRLDRPAGGRQDRHRAGVRRRVVLRLHAAARDVRVGGLPEGEIPL